MNDYVNANLKDFVKNYGELGKQRFADRLLQDIYTLRKRLGGVRYDSALSLLNNAIAALKNHNSTEGFIPFVETLLHDYYDPMYAYQSQNNQGEIVFSGDEKSILAWVETYTNQLNELRSY